MTEIALHRQSVELFFPNNNQKGSETS